MNRSNDLQSFWMEWKLKRTYATRRINPRVSRNIFFSREIRELINSSFTNQFSFQCLDCIGSQLLKNLLLINLSSEDELISTWFVTLLQACPTFLNCGPNITNPIMRWAKVLSSHFRILVKSNQIQSVKKVYWRYWKTDNCCRTTCSAFRENASQLKVIIWPGILWKLDSDLDYNTALNFWE